MIIYAKTELEPWQIAYIKAYQLATEDECDDMRNINFAPSPHRLVEILDELESADTNDFKLGYNSERV